MISNDAHVNIQQLATVISIIATAPYHPTVNKMYCG